MRIWSGETWLASSLPMLHVARLKAVKKQTRALVRQRRSLPTYGWPHSSTHSQTVRDLAPHHNTRAVVLNARDRDASSVFLPSFRPQSRGDTRNTSTQSRHSFNPLDTPPYIPRVKDIAVRPAVLAPKRVMCLRHIPTNGIAELRGR